MLDDLSEVRARLQVCQEDIEKAAKLEEVFLTKHLSLIAYQMNEHIPRLKQTTWTARITGDVPIGFRSKVGTIANELRSCLDELATRLAIRNGAKRLGDVHFPILKNSAVFNELGMGRRIKELSQNDRQIIASLKPYEGGNDTLFQLAAVDNMRKHQRLMVCLSASSGVTFNGFVSLGQFAITGGALVEANKKETAFAYGVDCHGDILFTFRITFREPESAKGKPVIPFLWEALAEVLRVVNLF